jgi:glycosyltransferase involved in cell wall biosynthesis
MVNAGTNRYVLITPVRNEEKTIEITIQSVIHQTLPPAEWVIVSDESTDRTDEIISRYSAKYEFIQFLRLTKRPSRNFASVVFAVEAGYGDLKTKDYAFLGILDGDVRLAQDYYEQIVAHFTSDPSLGLAGGLVLDNVDGKSIRHRQYLRDVAGAVQFFRRTCFESLGGLTAIPEGGWDAITCVRARMNGFRTATVPDLVVEHLKPRNIAEGNLFRRNWQLGTRDYALGGHPLFEVVKCCARTLDSPLLIGAVARLFGYSLAAMTWRQRFLPKDVVNYIRREQLARLQPFRNRRSIASSSVSVSATSRKII